MLHFVSDIISTLITEEREEYVSNKYLIIN